MKRTYPSLKTDFATTITHLPTLGLSRRVGAIIIFAGLLVSSLYWSSTASTHNNASVKQDSVAQGDQFNRSGAANVGSNLLGLRGSSSLFALPLPPPPPPAVATYASNCTTSKSVFNLQDTDLTVCAVVTDAPSSWRILWSNANNTIVQDVPVGSGTSTFTLTAGSSLGDWRVIVYEPFGNSVFASTSFTVIDANNPRAEVSVSKTLISGSASAGGQVLFAVQIANAGPSEAAGVSLSDAVPANTTFVSFDQFNGPIFECMNPTAGAGTGSSVCTLATLNRGETATFLATYQIGSVASGTVISNTASATSTTPDSDLENNSATASIEVSGAACQLSTPDNITVDADAGQAGAVVTYATPTGTGDCGTAQTDPDSGVITPAISCSPASGSFFPAGSTTVICTAQTGAATSFQVTVNNPGGLSISLTGASTMSVECGSDFSDPGATAVNGTGQSVPVVTTYPAGFDPGAPAVGSYEITYTATEDPNSVSTTRTVNVSDNEPPAITIDGANPYKIQQGSCSPFVDPGASANDGCAGAKPVTSSISGPGGATSVNPAVPGTYTVTYTATDGTYSATATRTVIVGNFPEDEVDQPATSNVPPTITLNGPDQVTIDCQTYVDPGATAAVCGTSVPVTTTGTVDGHTPGTYTITYSATANGFTTTATRTVTVEPDNTAPVITLNGANPMTVECHTSFTDPGAVAHDACAGDFPATASGSVNPNVVGTYVITYNATDPSGHAATPVTRTVNVVDTTNPTISCQANIIVDFNSAVNGAVVTYTTPVGADTCSSTTTTQTTGLPSGATFPLGTTTNTFTATDSSGHTASCSFTVTVAVTAIIGLDSVTMTGSGYADSYSSAGGYPATKGSQANILSNGTITMGNSAKVWGNVRSTRAGINMSGASQITGNATAATTVSRSGSATVGGTITNNTQGSVMTLPSVAPCSPFSSNSGITGTYSYNAATGDLTLSGVNIATLANGNYCFHNITLGNSSQLKVNGPVVIKMTGTLNTSGATSLNNTTQIPSNLRILSSYSGSNGIVLGNSANVYALLYAPTTGLNLSGAAPLFGTFAGKTLIIGSSGAIHYDTQLKTAWPAVWALLP